MAIQKAMFAERVNFKSDRNLLLMCLDHLLDAVWPFLFVRGNKNFAILPISHAPSNAVGFTRNLLFPSVATRCTQSPFA
jgi:hypothetical protein